MNALKGNRTRILGLLIGIFGAVEMYAPEMLSGATGGLVTAIAGALVIFLRQITDTPPGKTV